MNSTMNLPLVVIHSAKGPTAIRVFRTKVYVKLARKCGLHRRRNTVYIRQLDSAFY